MPPILPDPLLAFDSAASPLAERLTKIDSGVERDAQLPNTAEALRIAYTYHSNAIEGSTLTLRETQLIIEGKSLPAGKSMREVYEARNHDRAVRRIEALAFEGGAIDEQVLLDLHGLVLADIAPAEAGVYRTGRVRIAGSRFIPPGSHRFAELMPVVFDRARATGLHPVLRAAELHYNLVAIHPFSDGNGRTARLMMNALLLKVGYPLCIIEVERRADYLTALDAANASDPLPFATLIVEQIEQSAGDTREQGPG
ncbi:MAG: Fic family protein [Phycisphaeraceae bacterium]